jgi:hypothetical protein
LAIERALKSSHPTSISEMTRFQGVSRAAVSLQKSSIGMVSKNSRKIDSRYVSTFSYGGS